MATALLTAPPLAAQGTDRELLAKMVRSPDPDARMAARTAASVLGAPAIATLADLMVDANREAAITAGHALDRIVHSAGRAGSEASRPAVIAELVKLLASDRPAAVRREAVHLLAFIGGDESAEAVAPLLKETDAVLREAARLSLERVPGEASLRALTAAAADAPDVEKGMLIHALGKKGAAGIPAIQSHLASKSGEVRLAALETLARLGTTEASAPLLDELGRASDAESARLFDEVLRLADNVKAKDAALSKSLHTQALEKASLDSQREHAFGALVASGDESALPLISRGLTDNASRVRRVAAQRLAELGGASVVPAMVRLYDDARGPQKALLLRAISGRDAEAARPHLERAAREGSGELRITALDLLGKMDEPRMEAEYLRAAESGPEWLRQSGLRGYLAVAKGKVSTGAKDDALKMFEKVLGIAQEPELRLEALRGVLAVGDARSIPTVEALSKDPQLGQEATRGLVELAVALGKSGDRDGAGKRLLAVALGDYPRELKTRAIDSLRSLGLDPQKETHAQGFVVNWWVVTPLPNGDGKGLERKDFPEDLVTVDREQRVGERKFRWQRTTELSLDGKVDLLSLFRRTENVVTYAYAELDAAQARDVVLKFGSNDGLALWLNGEKLFMKNSVRELKIDEDSVHGKLVAGKNKLLVKVSQKDGDWGFALRLVESDGKPIDVGGMVEKR